MLGASQLALNGQVNLQKVMLSYEWFDSYEKLSHIAPVGDKDFYSRLKTPVVKDEHDHVLIILKANNAQQQKTRC